MKKSTIVAVVVFLGLLVLVFMMLGRKEERGITRISLASIQTSDLDRIAITGKNPIEMKRQDKTWILSDGRPADADSVQKLIEAIPKIESSDLVTKDPNRFAELEVDAEKGTQISVYSNNKLVAEFTVGKSAAGGSHVKIKDGVYLVRQLYAYAFSKSASSWHQLKLFDAKIEDVTKVEVAIKNTPPYTLVKKEENWVLEDPKVVPENFRFDPASGQSLVSSFVNLRAQDIALDNPPAEKTSLDKDYDLLSFTDKSGTKQELHIGKNGENNTVYVQPAGKTDVFLLNKYSADNLRKKVVDLRDLKMIQLDIEKTQKLSITDGKKNLVFEKQGADWKIGKSSDKLPGDFELDPQAVTRRLQSLANARAVNVSSENAPQTGLATPEALVSATLEDGSTVSLVFGKQTKQEEREVVFAKGNVDKEVYLASKSLRTSLTGGLDTFKKRPMPPQGGFNNLDPQALSKLPPEVRAGLMKQMQEQKQQQMMIQKVQEQMKSKEQSATAGKK
jgi:hypothetical protein